MWSVKNQESNKSLKQKMTRNSKNAQSQYIHAVLNNSIVYFLRTEDCVGFIE